MLSVHSAPKGHLDYSGPTSSSASAAFTALNLAIPHSGLGDTNFLRLVKSCIKPIFNALQPDALVLQCGLDGLAGDPCKEFNLSLGGYGDVISEILGWSAVPAIPVLLLGGGGYNTPNAARGWAYLTSIALGRPLELDIETVPEDCEMWEKLVGKAEQGESLDVPASSGRRDENTEDDLLEIEGVFARYVGEIAKRAKSKR
jgi:histone deacetylase 8